MHANGRKSEKNAKYAKELRKVKKSLDNKARNPIRRKNMPRRKKITPITDNDLKFLARKPY